MFKRLWEEYGVSVILGGIAFAWLMVYLMGLYCCTHLDDPQKKEVVVIEQVEDV